MLKLAHLQLERESKDSHTGILHQLVERSPNTQEGQEASKIPEDFESISEKFLMPEVGLEPTRAKAHWILNPARLPISPLRLKRSLF